MKTAWCTEHRGVMRIAFFDPPPKHFDRPCPRCYKPLEQFPARNPHDHTPWLTTTTAAKMDNVHRVCPDNAVCHHGCSNGVCWRVMDRSGPLSNVFQNDIWPDEVVTRAPIPLCSCCEHFKVRLPGAGYCAWCVDCPTEYCDIPRKYLTKGNK